MVKYIKIALIALASAIYSIRAIVNSRMIPDGSGFYELSRKWSRLVLKLLGVKLNVVIAGNIPKDSAIYASNHSSLADIPALLSAIPDDIRIIYKKELEKIPLFGTCLRLSPFIAIERENARNAMGSIDKAVDSVKNGVSVVVFPEGTRSKDGALGEFKRGAFMLASRSGKPIVPVSISGASRIVPAGSFQLHSGTIDIVIHNPVQYELPLSKKDELELMSNVRSEIASAI